MLLLHEVAGINWQVMNVVHDEGEALILCDTYNDCEDNNHFLCVCFGQHNTYIWLCQGGY